MADITYACNVVSQESSDKTGTGLSPNVAAVLTYVLGWVSGLLFLLIERKNNFVRFHAAQSVLVFGPVTIAGILIGLIPVAGWMINTALAFFAFILWIELMVRASVGQTCTVPLASTIAKRQLKER
jgi:uncharacterized membrane protein